MDIIFEEKDRIGKVTLNRPRALNALTLPMLQELDTHLDLWQANDAIEMVVITSSSGRAFCAGADVKIFYENGLEKRADSFAFCRLEYSLCQKLFHYPKPYVALMNGIVMGGGVGISLHGSHPIATDTMKFALPEVAIGFFPDVGSTYFLPRLSHHVGWYMAMTGNSINASVAKAIGLIKHVIDHTKIDKFFSYLPDRIDEGLEECRISVGLPDLDFAKIESCFSKPSVEEIIACFGKEAFRGKCPSSIRLALMQMQKGSRLTFDEAIAYELALAEKRLQEPELYEGIYYRLIKKEIHPLW